MADSEEHVSEINTIQAILDAINGIGQTVATQGEQIAALVEAEQIQRDSLTSQNIYQPDLPASLQPDPADYVCPGFAMPRHCPNCGEPLFGFNGGWFHLYDVLADECTDCQTPVGPMGLHDKANQGVNVKKITEEAHDAHHESHHQEQF